MSFFMNPFPQEYRGSLLLGDRQHVLTFDVQPNAGRSGSEARSFTAANWDLSGADADGTNEDLLTFSFALDTAQVTFVDLTVDIGSTAASLAAVKPAEVVSALNANTPFSTNFSARVSEDGTFVRILTKKDQTRIRWYIKHGGADTVMNWNKFVGIKELPTYFARHTIANRYTFEDCTSMLVLLDPAGNTVDANLIDAAVNNKGVDLEYASGTVRADYILMGGRSGIFQFTKNTVDGSSRITETIEYPAGAVVGDLAKKILKTYTAAQTQPDQVTEEPYTLTSGDLVTP